MSNSLDTIYKNQSAIYKYVLYLLSIALVVYFFPKGGKFKYEFQKGKPWQYENLSSPIDFSIKKTSAEIALEKKELTSQKLAYYNYDGAISDPIISDFEDRFYESSIFQYLNDSKKQELADLGVEILHKIYEKGVSSAQISENRLKLVKSNRALELSKGDILSVAEVEDFVTGQINKSSISENGEALKDFIVSGIKPNVFYDKELTENAINDELSRISFTRGEVREGELIIATGEVVEGENLKKLNSLKSEYESELWSGNNSYFILFGYTVLVALVLMMLFLFLKNYRPEIFADNNKVTFIFTNLLLMVFITTLVVKTNENYVYVVPLCILPLILKNFFDARLGLFVHVLTILLLGFVVPNSFEYIFLQIIAGIITILTVSELYKRANLFISVGQITLIYIIGYFAFHIIHEGSLKNIEWMTFGIFLLNGMITLFAQPLIYLYEKIFGLVSDVSLLELSDTNSKLLKELSDKAPGTFHHSLQVANLAEAAANQIGANSMLVRVGALYHDVGKMENPTFFTENQVTNINPHDDLPPKESAKIIIDHVIKGIEIARKNNIPDRVIDFLRTHHGTSLVYYFYKKQKESGGELNEEDFTYPGPKPFSKETAILMMADAVEAASKSLSTPNSQIIDDFVERIVKSQMNAEQFLNANITLKEIEAVKKVLKQKLINIYHLRVEYPD